MIRASEVPSPVSVVPNLVMLMSFRLVSYSAGYVKRAFIEPVAVADELPPMPLFLEAEVYVPVPLEATYRAAFAAVPKRWQEELG